MGTILVVAEIQGGKIREASFELASFAQKIAAASNRTVASLVMGKGSEERAQELFKEGVITGTAQVNNARGVIVSGNCPNGPQTGQTWTWGMPSAAVSGSPSSMTFTQQLTNQGQDTPTSPVTTVTNTSSA